LAFLHWQFLRLGLASLVVALLSALAALVAGLRLQLIRGMLAPTTRSTPLPLVAGRCAIKPRSAGQLETLCLMTETISAAAAENNELLLARVEDLGGGYCWDAEIFAVTLMDVAVADPEAAMLCGLVGVQQIALNASLLSFPIVERVAHIPGLKSLVLNTPSISEVELDVLKRVVPKVLVVDEYA
jgi:hypothetical protein